jgi:hypothetical protein
MELHHAKRSLFQTALSSIVYRRQQRAPSDDRVPDRADPGRPAIERAAVPRAVAWSESELAEAGQRLRGESHRAILDALRSTDPTDLISAVSEHDTSATPVVSEVVATLASVRLENIRRGLTELMSQVEDGEQQLANRVADDAVGALEKDENAERSRLQRIAGVVGRMPPAEASAFINQVAGAAPSEIDRRLDDVEIAPAPAAAIAAPLRRPGRGP